MRRILLIYIIPLALLCAVLGCGSSDDDTGQLALGIRDTVQFDVSFVAGGKLYSFTPRPGDTDLNGAVQQYKLSGSLSFNASHTVSSITQYIEMKDTENNVTFRLGYAYSPGRVTPIVQDVRCKMLKEDFLKYFPIGNVSLCHTGIYNDFLGCLNGNANEFIFQIELIDGANNKKYKSGIEVVPGSFLRIDMKEPLEYLDQSSTASFHWLLTGEFAMTLHEYDDAGSIPENPTALPIENGRFKIGWQNPCL
jgi:hypothetical protein